MKYGSLGKRVAVGAVGIPVLLGLTWIGKIPFLILCLVITIMALLEYYQLTSKKEVSPSQMWGVISIAAIGLNIYFFRGKYIEFLMGIIIMTILLIELFKNKKNPIFNSAITLFGIFYISLFYGLLLIREFLPETLFSYGEKGLFVIYLLLIIWICDTDAYLLGARFGKHALFKRVSPNKTWEGAIWGLITGIMASIGLRYAFLPKLHLVDATVIGFIVGTFGQLSDLVESLLKRDAQVKDSSSILPGHGGILDRFDSPLLVAPTVYFYMLIILQMRM